MPWIRVRRTWRSYDAGGRIVIRFTESYVKRSPSLATCRTCLAILPFASARFCCQCGARVPPIPREEPDEGTPVARVVLVKKPEPAE